MQYRNLGASGLKISALSYGSWVTFGTQVNKRLAESLIGTAHDSGVNFFDNAEAYSYGESEIIMGKALKSLRLRRESYLVSSKVFGGCIPNPTPTERGLSRKHVFEACHQALKRLQIDYLDLYFCHRPDPETPILETAYAMHDLIRQGKVLYWGTSEWPAPLIQQTHEICSAHHLTPPITEQPQYNLFCRQRVEVEYEPLYRQFCMGLTTWSPLASGLLTGKYLHELPGKSRMSLPGCAWLKKSMEGKNGQNKATTVKQLVELAGNFSLTPAQLALMWCLSNANVSSIILGASTVEQLRENLKSVDKLTNIDGDSVKSLSDSFHDLHLSA